MTIRLMADVLDKQLLDATDDNAGRVDGIVLALRDDKPPRLAYLEVSPITLLSRFSLRLAHWYAPLDRRFGEGRGVPFRIPWSRVSRFGATLKLDFVAESTPINALEGWLRANIVDRMPLAHGKSPKQGGR